MFPGLLELSLADLAGRELRVTKVEGRVDRPVPLIAGKRGPVRPQLNLAQPAAVPAMLSQPLGALPVGGAGRGLTGTREGGTWLADRRAELRHKPQT